MSETFCPGERVYVLRDNKAGRLEGFGVVVRYYRNNAWWVRLEPHGAETVFDQKEIFPVVDGEKKGGERP